MIAGEAYIYVNDQPAVNISELNSRAGYADVVPVQLKLKPGDVNTITVGSVGGGGKRQGPVLIAQGLSESALTVILPRLPCVHRWAGIIRGR